MSITHKFVSAIADGADTSVVRPSNWNDTHQIDNSTITEAMLSISDNTTANVSTSAHGFAPKVTNTANYLKGDGTWSNPGSNSGPTFPGGIPITGMKYANGGNVSVSTGDTDLYTVPANKRALFIGGMLFNASGIGNIVWYFEVKISGAYYRLTSNSTTSNAAVGTSNNVAFVGEAGEIFAINTTTNNGAVVFMTIVEFDSSVAIKSSRLLTLASGDNTIYTATGVTALNLGNSLAAFPTGSGVINYVNDSGAGRTVIPKVKPSGGSATATQASNSPATATRLNLTGPTVMQNGDALVINTDANTATQIAWVNVMEI